MSGEDVEGFGRICNANSLPADWACERFTLVNAGNGKYAFHNSLHNRFIRLCHGFVDTCGGPKYVNNLPSESVWESERFEIIMHPLSLPILPTAFCASGVKGHNSSVVNGIYSKVDDILCQDSYRGDGKVFNNEFDYMDHLRSNRGIANAPGLEPAKDHRPDYYK